MQKILAFLRDENGPTAVEYAVMLALIIVVCLTAITATGGGVLNIWQDNLSQFEGATGS